MKRLFGIVAIAAVIGGSAVAPAFGQERGRPDAPAEGMMGRMGEMMGGGPMHGMSEIMDMHAGGLSAERPWISLALQNRQQLGLSADQAKTLEAIRSEFQKEATRRSAEIQIAELELSEFLRAEPVDLAKVEAKLRQIEVVRMDLRLSRIKVLEKGKALLTPEQRKKLESLSSRASAAPSRGMMPGRGMDEMHRFMQSERMPQAMSSMMDMARQMGNGDTMAGMVRMMEMMGMMGQMMEGQMDGMMGSAQPPSSKEK